MKLTTIILLLACTSCASIVSQHTYNVSIKRHEGAKVTITDRNDNIVKSGTSPFRVKLRANDGAFKRQEYYFEFTQNGEVLENETIRCNLDPWFFGNFFLGAIPFVIDGLTGSMYKLERKSLK